MLGCDVKYFGGWHMVKEFENVSLSGTFRLMKVLLLDRLETAAVSLPLNTCPSTSPFLSRLEPG